MKKLLASFTLVIFCLLSPASVSFGQNSTSGNGQNQAIEQLNYQLENAAYLRSQGDHKKARKIAAETAKEAADINEFHIVARAIHEEGLAFMAMDKLQLMNKGLAISKFQKSQKILEQYEIEDDELEEANYAQIDVAEDFYDNIGNNKGKDFVESIKKDLEFDENFGKKLDSTLAKVNAQLGDINIQFRKRNEDTASGTPTEADSENPPSTPTPRIPPPPPSTPTINQPKVQIPKELSKEVETLIALSKNQAEKEFLENTEAFVIEHPKLDKNETPDRLRFDIYWPLEKEAIEKRFINKQKKVESMNSNNAKEELLLAYYKQQFDSLQYLRSIDSVTLVKNKLALEKQASEAAAQRANKMLQMVASGSIGILALFLFWAYRRQRRSNRLLAQKNHLALEEKKRSEDLLLNILPAQVAKELKSHGTASANKFENVSVLFSDFKNFSQLAEKLSPVELVSELDYCFRGFDRIIEKYRLEKIKTIGDAYMCAGGLHTKTNEHISRIIKAAIEMQQFLAKWKEDKIAQNQPYLQARIGIHTGPVVAGVVGAKKFAYDIWGDTVNVAAQMETYGEIEKVNISGATYRFIKDEFNCIPRGIIKAKNNKEYEMYFVEMAPVKVKV